MNIVRVISNKKVYTVLLLAGGMVSAIHYALAPSHISVICDQRFAPQIQINLKKEIEHIHIRSLGALGLSQLLKKEVPCIDSVSLSYQSSGIARVIVKAQQPLVRITSSIAGNKEYLLCTQGLMVEKSLFSEHALDNIPTVIIEGPDYEQRRLLPEFIECVLALKTEVFDTYVVTWRSKSDILLQSRVNPIILNADNVTVHDRDRLTAVQRIYASDEERYSEGMKADIRLPDSIVCAQTQVT